MNARATLRAGHATPFDQLRVRRLNLALVLATVEREGPISRARLADQTQLNKTTVSNLVADLMSRGMLVETGDDDNPGAVGRPAQTLRVCGEHFAAVAIDVDYNRLAVCVVDLAGEVRYQSERQFDTRRAGPTGTADAIVELGSQGLDSLHDAGLQVVDVTIAVDAVIDRDGERIVRAPDLDWSMVPLAGMVRQGLAPHVGPLHVENDANVAALAELWLGVGQGLRDFVYVWGSVGIGAGIINSGVLLRGAHGFGGELGHITIDPAGPECTCGRRGCLGMFAGIDVLLARAGSPPRGSLSEHIHAIVERAARGERRALRALQETGEALSIGLTTLANILDPEAIILGGWYAPVAPWLIEPIQQALDARTRVGGMIPCRVLTSELGDEAPTRGAAAFSLRKVFADPSAYQPDRARIRAFPTVPPVWGLAG